VLLGWLGRITVGKPTPRILENPLDSTHENSAHGKVA